MKIKKRLYWDLILKYTLFLLLAVITTGAFIFALANITFNTFSSNSESLKYLNIKYEKIEFDGRTKELSLSEPLQEGSWIEILKDNRVIYVEGEKKDDKQSYTQEELAFIANNADELDSSYEYFYTYLPFTGQDGENYLLIEKSPKKITLGMDFELTKSNSGEKYKLEKQIKSKINLLFIFFILLLIIIILFLGRITSKKIIKPINKLNAGLNDVMNGDYSVKLDYKGSYEFEQLRDAFNYMTEKLRIAQKENKEISDSKKRLLLDISHDLKTPATTIQGYALALSNDMVQDEDKKKKYLEYIYQKSRHMTNLIERLFMYSKLDSSIYDLNKEIDDFSEFLRNIVISFYGEIDKKSFELDIDIPDEKVLYSFDKIEMERALSNIISNIIKYNPDKTTIFISLKEHEDRLEVILGDNGIGMSENVRKNVFNALVRGDTARKSDGGTGLGLAISKKIIELHGGKILLESQLGEGSKFYISLLK